MTKFESCKKSEGHVDKYSTVTVAQNHYSVPDTLVGKTWTSATYTDKIIIYHGGEIVARHERSFKGHDWKIDILSLPAYPERKPGALHKAQHCFSRTPDQKLFETYYSSDARTFLEVLEIIYKKA